MADCRTPIDADLIISVAPCHMCGAKRGEPCSRLRMKGVPPKRPHDARERLTGLLIKAHKKAGEPMTVVPAVK